MISIIKCLFVICSLTLLQCSYATLPSTIKTCPRNHPHIDQCILDAVNLVRPLLAKGDLGMGFYTPPLEPLALDNIEMVRGNEFQAVFSDIKAKGGSNFQIEKIRTNVTELLFDFIVLLPKIDFTGKYSLKIRVLLLHINGNGNMQGTFKNIRGFVRMRGIKVNKDGADYVHFDKMPIKIQVEDMKIHLDNLFAGDPVLGQVGNTVINENNQLFLTEVLPGLEKGLSKKFLEIANNILTFSTFDEMFPLN